MAVKLEKVHGPPVGNFFKTYLFWMKTYPIWKAVGGGGGTKSLNQKNRPRVVFKFLGPLSQTVFMDLELERHSNDQGGGGMWKRYQHSLFFFQSPG